MGRIPDETIQTIRDRVDIVDLVGRHVALKQAGRNFKGLCPFHDEKTPSFNVNRERQIYHCFGCGAGGNAITFLMEHENLTFPEAVRSLAQDVGVEIPDTGDDRERGAAEGLYRAGELAQRFFCERLLAPDAENARRYLARRGFDRESAARFGIGYAPDRWDGLVEALRKEGVSPTIGERAGLLAEGKHGRYDRLRGRVTFAIRDARGRVVGFGGRALAEDQEPKYLNTPESPVFRKREALYGLPDALEPIRRSGRVLVVEGYFDRIALARAGMEEAVATCGTALTPEHARALRRRSQEVVLLFDGDDAGLKAMERALAVLLPEGVRVRAALLPEGSDPDSLLEERGAEALRQVVDKAAPALEAVIQQAVSGGVRTPWEKADAVGRVIPLLALVRDRIERAEFARQLALATGTEARDVEAALFAALRGEDVDTEELVADRVRRRGPLERHLRGLIRILLDHPRLVSELDPKELLEAAPTEVWRQLLDAALESIREVEELDVSRLSERLDAVTREELLGIVAGERPELDAEEAARALRDTLSWLRRRSHADRKKELTQRFHDPEADATALLEAKQKQIEERRTIVHRS